ncbi:hypothetical protein VCR15J2_110010 [Vibrio coralliirubri]|uniref:glycosyltransferase n=1 Tax=Vibrio coralliirubri TaxID=1516159 RepID=UPI000639C26E|nr:glycosyltransferase [Vibrio coralliirubri]CDT25076.1 hypothetical protein VCR15J2_110010 [Vibrio coralliirubri]
MKVLIISPHFPTPDVYNYSLSQDPRTKFLITYAKEWVNKGHDVTVFHTIQKYPKILNFFLKTAALIFPWLTRFCQDVRSTKRTSFFYEGMGIIREPIIKFLPHRKLPSFIIRRYVFNNIVNNNRIDFDKYDVILLDYLSPSLDFFKYLDVKANIYPIFHQTDWLYLNSKPSHYRDLLSFCSGVYFRNKTSQEVFNNRFSDLGLDTKIMYSGIPNDIEFGVPKVKVRKIIYVGRILKSKNIHDTLIALNLLPSEIKGEIEFEIIGDGEYLPELKRMVSDFSLTAQVSFTPKLEHKYIFEKMASADALVMVSKETFGMVYVEALSQGCIVIAAQNEGIDGVVVDGENGFLLPLNDPLKLSEALANLFSLSENNVKKISKKSISSASTMRNDMLASSLVSYFKR